MARMPKFRRFSNGDLILGYTAEADEVFKRNSEQQDKRREKSVPQVTSKPPEEVSLNNIELLRFTFEKANCPVMSAAYCFCFV